MRAIEKRMVAAIMARKAWTSGNTAVTLTPLGDLPLICVTLHGNTIAEIEQRNDVIRVTFAGWPTATTRSRINALLYAFAGNNYGVSIKQGEPQFHVRRQEGPYTSNPIGSRAWVTVPMSGPFNADLRQRVALAHQIHAEQVARDNREHPGRDALNGAPVEMG